MKRPMKPVKQPMAKTMKGADLKAVRSMRARLAAGRTRGFITRLGIRRVMRVMKPIIRTDQLNPMEV